MILIRNRLNAGFFSNLNAALGWYWYSMRTEIPIYIHWDGIPGQNVFDTFFDQKYKYESHNYEHSANVQHSSLFTDQMKEAWKEDIGETIYNKYDNGWFFCQGLLYTESHFDHLRKLYNYIYTENLKFRSELVQQPLIPENTLGINYRFLRFYYTNDGKRTPWHTFMSVEEYHKKYMDQIESAFENGKYDHIYLASSQRGFVELCQSKFKDKLLCLPMKRIEENQTEYDRGITLMEEYTNVLKDITNLINCKHLLISPSNLIFGVLFMNPNIGFSVFDFLKQTNTD
jgi:hypothetical protein